MCEANMIKNKLGHRNCVFCKFYSNLTKKSLALALKDEVCQSKQKFNTLI